MKKFIATLFGRFGVDGDWPFRDTCPRVSRSAHEGAPRGDVSINVSRREIFDSAELASCSTLATLAEAVATIMTLAAKV